VNGRDAREAFAWALLLVAALWLAVIYGWI